MHPAQRCRCCSMPRQRKKGTVTKQCERRPTLRAYLYHHEIAQHQCYCENLERVLPRAARISVLGIPRRGWRGFESPAKFKLLTMKRCPLSGALGMGRVKNKKGLLLDRGFLLQHRTGAWVMHIEHQLAQIAEWECLEE